MTKGTKVTVENVNIPGQTQQVDAMKYEAMKNAYLLNNPGKPIMLVPRMRPVTVRWRVA